MANKIGLRQYPTQTNRQVVNVKDEIFLIDGNDLERAGWLAFFMQTKARNTITEKYEWDIDEFIPDSDTLSAAVTGTTDTVLPVSNPTYFIENLLIRHKTTGEMMRVDEVDIAGSNIVVTRQISALSSQGGTSAAAMTSGSTLQILGSLVGEDSRRQTYQSSVPTTVTGYCTQFRKELSMSRRQVKRAFETGMELPYAQVKQMKEARRELNRIFIAGQKIATTTADGQWTTGTEGIYNVPTTNTLAADGVLQEYVLDSFLANNGFDKGSDTKLLLASRAVFIAMTEMVKDKVIYNLPLMPHRGSIGIRVMDYYSPMGGRLIMLHDRYMTEQFNGDAIGIDMSQISRRVFSAGPYNDDLHVISGTGEKDDLGHNETIFMDAGLEWGAEVTAFKISGVSGGMKGRDQV